MIPFRGGFTIEITNYNQRMGCRQINKAIMKQVSAFFLIFRIVIKMRVNEHKSKSGGFFTQTLPN